MYRCLTCGAESPHYYFYYNTAAGPAQKTENRNNIQLTQCQVCRSVVDPYMEREWLLVVMDLVLLRREAFRHVYWNRLQEEKARLVAKDAELKWLLRPSATMVIILLGAAASTILNRELWQWILSRIQDEQRLWSSTPLLELIASFRGLMILLMAEILVLYLWAAGVKWANKILTMTTTTTNQQTQQAAKQQPLDWWMVHAALWLPLLGGTLVGSMVALIWGNNKDEGDALIGDATESSQILPSIAENLGIMAVMVMWQVYGLRAVLWTAN